MTGIDREFYEEVLKKMDRISPSFMAERITAEKARSIMEYLLSYYEVTEEYEKCNGIKKFFTEVIDLKQKRN